MREIAQSLEALHLGKPQSVLNLTLFPIVSGQDTAPDYLLLDEALDRKIARVTEVSGEGAVPELAFENLSERKVLLVDGDELVGAKQNRVLNISILVGGGLRIAIPVSCVEQGRWTYRSREFAAAKRSLFAGARAKKMLRVSESMRACGSRRSDQSEIWSDVAEKMAFHHVRSDTSAMADVYQTTAERLDRFVHGFGSEPGQVGAVIAIGEKVAGMELFDAPQTFKRYLEKLVRAYAMDSIETAEVESRPASKAAAEAFLVRLKGLAAERFRALGEGEDLRLRGDGLAGAALAVNGRLVHFAAYAVGEAAS